MPEPMSDARLAEIRDVYIDDHEVIGELLAEVERLRAEDALAKAATKATAVATEVVWFSASFVLGVIVGTACIDALGWPWWDSFGAALLSGVLLGTWRLWREERNA